MLPVVTTPAQKYLREALRPDDRIDHHAVRAHALRRAVGVGIIAGAVEEGVRRRARALRARERLAGGELDLRARRDGAGAARARTSRESRTRGVRR